MFVFFPLVSESSPQLFAGNIVKFFSFLLPTQPPNLSNRIIQTPGRRKPHFKHPKGKYTLPSHPVRERKVNQKSFKRDSESMEKNAIAPVLTVYENMSNKQIIKPTSRSSFHTQVLTSPPKIFSLPYPSITKPITPEKSDEEVNFALKVPKSWVPVSEKKTTMIPFPPSYFHENVSKISFLP